MGKQPSAPGMTASRFSRPVGWIRDLPIWTKLGLILVVPTLATIIVGTVGLLENVQEANNADRARTLAVLGGDAGALAHRLQDERATAIQLLNAPATARAEVTRLVTSYQASAELTEVERVEYARSRSTLADLPEGLRALLDRIESQLGELVVMRDQVEGRTKIPRSVAEQRYRVLISDLLEIRNVAAQLTGDTTLTDRLRAAAAVASAKEFLSQERVVMLQALADHELSEAARRDYVSTRNGQELALGTFAQVATSDQVVLFNRALTGPEFRETLLFEGGFDSLGAGDDPASVVKSDKWDSSMSGRSDLMNTVETALNAQAQEAAAAAGAQVQRQVLLQTGLLLLTLLLGVLFAWLVARSMARSLRDLRQGALAVAQYGLPQAVSRLRDPALSTNMSPATVALQIAEPLPIRSRDEFGQVTEAFNAVHLEAVRTAAEQAALRSSVATMFVNLARRSQLLVDRLIGHLDRLERGEQDPDRLSELFQLDHLATRMRRNDENLLVLAGADSTRIQREPAALMDVLRAAQSEVEHYTRIEFGAIEPDIEIAAHAVNDMVHLVAELFDNATAFSPPDTSIIVEAHRVGDRAVLSVEDRGIGMSPDQYAELNERLATPPMVDVAVSRMMGLVVVARLAARHGVKTELRPARERGTVAEIMMPGGVLVPRALAGRSQMPAGFPAAIRPPGIGGPGMPPPSGFGAPPGIAATSTSRPSFPAPLALESAPAATPWGAPPPVNLWATDGPASPPASSFSGFGPASPAPGAGPAGEGPGAFSGGAGPGGGGAGGLGAALAGHSGWGPNGAGGPNPGQYTNGPNGAGRNLPAWSDLTGAGGQDDPAPGATPEDPLPQRRPVWGADPDATSTGPTIPHQPSAPEARGLGLSSPGGRVPQGPGVTNFPPPSGFGASPAPARPPAWPPVAGSEPDAVPALPESLSASLDMTSELPRIGGDSGYGSGADAASRYADDLTMELPIFRELESAWFRPPGDDSVARSESADSWAQDGTGSTAMRGSTPAGTASRSGRTGGTDGAAGDSGEVSWPSAADDGWLAAQAALEPHDGGTTGIGLPRRVPMAQLVPGGVETASGGSDRRTPDAVRGLLSAYTRGVQRGRDAHGNAEPATDSQTSGKEQEA